MKTNGGGIFFFLRAKNFKRRSEGGENSFSAENFCQNFNYFTGMKSRGLIRLIEIGAVFIFNENPVKFFEGKKKPSPSGYNNFYLSSFNLLIGAPKYRW